MKKLIFGLLLFFAASTKLSAQVTDPTTGTKYWYYPTQNIYYNDVTGEYWYYDKTGVKWVDAKQLPDMYKIMDNDKKYVVFYNGTDVWKENRKHLTKYKVKKKKNGKIKEKTKPNR